MIRKFMRGTFPKVLDILFAISVVGVVIAAFSAGSAQGALLGRFSFMGFITALIPGGIGVIFVFGVMYILLDIRDALQGKKQE
jgi:hypothetical protein